MMAKVSIIAQIAAMLSNILGRPVLDKTGISGEFDMTLDSPDVNMGRPQLPGRRSRASIFTAIQEQLGLRLEPSRGPVETLVVDHVAQSEN